VQAMPPDLCTASRYVACHAVPREVALFAALNDAMPKHVSVTITINHQLTEACFASNATNMVLLRRGLGMAVASPGPYANNLHLAPNR